MNTPIIMNDAVSSALANVQDPDSLYTAMIANLERYIHRSIQNQTNGSEDLEALMSMYQLRELFEALKGGAK